jgi:glycine hydroxymethyltransferase
MLMSSISELIEQEQERQASTLSLIASENHASKAVLEAQGSVFSDKYAEGYPGKRYYAGNGIADQIETACIEAAQLAFRTDYHVNVQPYSGSVANLATYSALLDPGDTVLAMSLGHGGHLTHGHEVSFTARVFRFVHYGVQRDSELIDYDEVLAQAREHRPKLIVCGATAYPTILDFQAFARIAREVGAWLLVDMSHIAGLVAGGVHQSPFGHADVITTTTHKTLRGPRAAMIFCRPEFAKAIDRAVFPGLQGGPQLHAIAAKTVALQEARQPAFRDYAKQVVLNAQALAYRLQQHGFRLVADGTDTHLFLMDLRPGRLRGKEAQILLEEVGITCNMNSLPFDDQPPSNPSGLRFGTAAVTTRGMKEQDMERLGDCIAGILHGDLTPQQAATTIATLTKKFRLPVR